MTDKESQLEEKKPRRLLFNKSGMGYRLKDGPPYEVVDGKETAKGVKRFFATGTAIEPLDEKEEKFLLDYGGVVFADTIMPASQAPAELAAAKKKVADLTAENKELRDQLQGSLAAGVGGGKARR